MADIPCSGLGSRLRDIETQEFLKNVVLIVFGDWVLNGDYYTLDIPKALHTKGNNPIMQVEIGVGLGFESIGLDGELWAANGDVTLRVVSNPDGRFDGRAVFT